MSTTLEDLKSFQSWRKGGRTCDCTGVQLSTSIDDAIAALEERPIARKAAVMMAGEILSRLNHADSDLYTFTEEELVNYSSSIAREWKRIADSERKLADSLQNQLNKMIKDNQLR